MQYERSVEILQIHEAIDSTKFLSVHISHDLSWNTDISNTAKRQV